MKLNKAKLRNLILEEIKMLAEEAPGNIDKRIALGNQIMNKLKIDNNSIIEIEYDGIMEIPIKSARFSGKHNGLNIYVLVTHDDEELDTVPSGSPLE